MNTVWSVDLGVIAYAEALELQHRIVAARKKGDLEDTLLLLEHPPVYTLGRNAKPEHVLASPEYLSQVGIQVFRVERGGDVTYHGPGQLVGYPILDLHNFRLDVGWYVRALEEVLIRTVNAFGLIGKRVGADLSSRDPKYVGVWVDNPVADPIMRRVQPEAKLAQIGARIENWITYHGFALNVSPIMEHFNFIVPCGIPDKPVTSIALASGRSVDMAEVKKETEKQFGQVFDARVVSVGPAELAERLGEKTSI